MEKKLFLTLFIAKLPKDFFFLSGHLPARQEVRTPLQRAPKRFSKAPSADLLVIA